MKNLIWFAAIALAVSFNACNGDSSTYAMIETDFGNMKVKLYDSTPKHKENFIKLANEGFYDDLLFHRVIQGFMIQGGDPDSRNASPTQRLGAGGPGYTLEAEIGAPHLKGTLAAARQGDNVNPEKRSSGSQFYIVQGKPATDQEINAMASRGINYNETQKKLYKEVGGTMFLDGNYTVFGEIVEGMDVIDKIAAVKTAPGDRPVEDVKMKVRILN